MTTMKKLVSLLLAAMMLLAVMNVAVAEGEGETTATKNNSITVNDAKEGETYSIYKLFDLSVNDEIAPTAYTYTVNSSWNAFFGENGAGAAYITKNDDGYVTGISDAAALAKAAAEYASANSIASAKTAVTVDKDATTAVFSELDNGYYLITSTLGTVAMTETTPDDEAVSINEKNPEDTIVKTVKEDSTGNYGESNDAQIGDTVEFKSVATLLPGTRNVVIHDTMTSGLTYTAGSVSIEGLVKGTDYTVNESPTDGCTFEIVFEETYLNGLTASTTLNISYSAVLNSNAVAPTTNGEGDSATTTTGIVDQTNTTQITYGDAQSVEDQTTTTTHKFTVNKYADGVENLAGAVFQLKKGDTVIKLTKIDDCNYKVDTNGALDSFETVATGDIVIWGVDADNDYILNETEAPEGYNSLSAPVSVTVGAENTTKIDVENKTGTELPSTGGIGTTIFYAVGGVLVLLAVVLLVTKRRVGEEN